MFRVEFFVDDKKLGQALIALVGLAYGQPSVVPVVNTVVKNGHIKAESNDTKMLDLFAMHLKKIKKDSLQVDDIKEFLTSIGRSPISSGYLIKQAIHAKIIKRVGKSSNVRFHLIKD